MKVHKAMSAAVLDVAGMLRMASMIETKAETIRQFVQALHPTLNGSSSASAEGWFSRAGPGHQLLTKTPILVSRPTGSVRLAIGAGYAQVWDMTTVTNDE